MARLLANLPVLRAGLPPLVVPRERRLDYLRAIAAYQLSIPGFPDNSVFPANQQSAAFVALCGTFQAEVLQYIEEARRRQRARDAAGAPRD